LWYYRPVAEPCLILRHMTELGDPGYGER
jgi:hypothetical protein